MVILTLIEEERNRNNVIRGWEKLVSYSYIFTFEERVRERENKRRRVRLEEMERVHSYRFQWIFSVDYRL